MNWGPYCTVLGCALLEQPLLHTCVHLTLPCPGVCIPLESHEHTGTSHQTTMHSKWGWCHPVPHCTRADCTVPCCTGLHSWSSFSYTIVTTPLYHATCLLTSREPGAYSTLHQTTMHSNAMHKEPCLYKRSPVDLVV